MRSTQIVKHARVGAETNTGYPIQNRAPWRCCRNLLLLRPGWSIPIVILYPWFAVVCFLAFSLHAQKWKFLLPVRRLAEGATFRVKGARVGTGEVVPRVGPPSAPSQQPDANGPTAEDVLALVVNLRRGSGLDIVEAHLLASAYLGPSLRRGSLTADRWDGHERHLVGEPRLPLVSTTPPAIGGLNQ